MSYQEAIGYRFGVRAAWTTPDTMHDHVLLHSRSAVHELPVLHKKLCEKKKACDVIHVDTRRGGGVGKNRGKGGVMRDFVPVNCSGFVPRFAQICPDSAQINPLSLLG